MRRHAKLFLHPGQVAAFAVHGVNNGDVLIHQLGQVFVATADNDFNALVSGDNGQRANHVIGFHARHVQHRPAQEAHYFVNRHNLATQIVGHRRAIGLVRGVNVIPEGRAFGIKHAGYVVGRHLFTQALHHVDHDADSACLLHRTIRQGGAHGFATGKEGAVQVAGAVYEQ